jgi:hypothetical protein
VSYRRQIFLIPCDQDDRGDGLAGEGIVSETHGDKARFAKQRHSRLLRRKRLREMRKAMSLGNRTRTIQAEPRQGANEIEAVRAQAEHIVLEAPSKSKKGKSKGGPS